MESERSHYVEALDQGCVLPVVRRWRAERPTMGILALLPEAEHGGVERLQKICREERVPLVGGVFPALIVDDRLLSLGGWLLRLDEMPCTFLYPELPADGGDLSSVAGAVVDAIRPALAGEGDATLMLLCDGMFPRVGSLLDELYLRLANRVRYAGANAGSESFKALPCVFDGERVAPRGLLAIVLRGVGAALAHGYPVPQRLTTATSTEGNRIRQIEWLPAFEVYQALGREEFGVEIDRANFYEHAVHFPFGIVRANGVILVRIPVALEEDGSIFCVGEVPPNSILTLLDAPKVDSARTVDELVRGLSELGAPPAGEELLLFYCAGRRLHLGAEPFLRELRELGGRSGARRVVGVLSLGEIGGAADGYPLFHNAALVASRWRGR
jgi:hypothetical protein